MSRPVNETIWIANPAKKLAVARPARAMRERRSGGPWLSSTPASTSSFYHAVEVVALRPHKRRH
jgi:hypothetical protein